MHRLGDQKLVGAIPARLPPPAKPPAIDGGTTPGSLGPLGCRNSEDTKLKPTTFHAVAASTGERRLGLSNTGPFFLQPTASCKHHHWRLRAATRHNPRPPMLQPPSPLPPPSSRTLADDPPPPPREQPVGSSRDAFAENPVAVEAAVVAVASTVRLKASCGRQQQMRETGIGQRRVVPKTTLNAVPASASRPVRAAEGGTGKPARGTFSAVLMVVAVTSHPRLHLLLG